MIVLLLRYADQGQFYRDHAISKQLFDERLTAHRQKAHAHPAIGDYYEQLLRLFETHPEYFHQPDTA